MKKFLKIILFITFSLQGKAQIDFPKGMTIEVKPPVEKPERPGPDNTETKPFSSKSVANSNPPKSVLTTQTINRLNRITQIKNNTKAIKILLSAAPFLGLPSENSIEKSADIILFLSTFDVATYHEAFKSLNQIEAKALDTHAIDSKMQIEEEIALLNREHKPTETLVIERNFWEKFEKSLPINQIDKKDIKLRNDGSFPNNWEIVSELIGDVGDKLKSKKYFTDILYRTGGINQARRDFAKFNFAKVLGQSDKNNQRLDFGQFDDNTTVDFRMDKDNVPTLGIGAVEGNYISIKYPKHLDSDAKNPKNIYLYEVSINRAKHDGSATQITQSYESDKIIISPSITLSNTLNKDIIFYASFKCDGQYLNSMTDLIKCKQKIHFETNTATTANKVSLELPYSSIMINSQNIEKIDYQISLADLSNNDFEPYFINVPDWQNGRSFYFDNLNKKVISYSEIKDMVLPLVNYSFAKKIDGTKWYNFSISLGGIERFKSHIKRVVYKPKDVSFDSLNLNSNNKTNNFLSNWLGWGCVQEIVVWVYLNDDTYFTKKINMCEKLGW
jgi:hypothetical protein